MVVVKQKSLSRKSDTTRPANFCNPNKSKAIQYSAVLRVPHLKQVQLVQVVCGRLEARPDCDRVILYVSKARDIHAPLLGSLSPMRELHARGERGWVQTKCSAFIEGLRDRPNLSLHLVLDSTGEGEYDPCNKYGNIDANIGRGCSLISCPYNLVQNKHNSEFYYLRFMFFFKKIIQYKLRTENYIKS